MQPLQARSRFASLLTDNPDPHSPCLSPLFDGYSILRASSPPWFLTDSPATPTAMQSHPPPLYRFGPSTSPLSPLPYLDIDSFLQHELSIPLPSTSLAVQSEDTPRASEGVDMERPQQTTGRRGSDCSYMSLCMSTSSSPNSALSLSRTSSPQLSHPSSSSSASSTASTASPLHAATLLSVPASSSATPAPSSSYSKLTTRRGRRLQNLDIGGHVQPRALRRKHGASCHMYEDT